MQHHQSLQDLSGNRDCVVFRNDPMLLYILAQIAVLDILHRKVNRVLVFIPAEENDEVLRILILLSG